MANGRQRVFNPATGGEPTFLQPQSSFVRALSASAPLIAAALNQRFAIKREERLRAAKEERENTLILNNRKAQLIDNLNRVSAQNSVDPPADVLAKIQGAKDVNAAQEAANAGMRTIVEGTREAAGEVAGAKAVQTFLNDQETEPLVPQIEGALGGPVTAENLTEARRIKGELLTHQKSLDALGSAIKSVGDDPEFPLPEQFQGDQRAVALFQGARLRGLADRRLNEELKRAQLARANAEALAATGDLTEQQQAQRATLQGEIDDHERTINSIDREIREWRALDVITRQTLGADQIETELLRDKANRVRVRNALIDQLIQITGGPKPAGTGEEGAPAPAPAPATDDPVLKRLEEIRSRAGS